MEVFKLWCVLNEAGLDHGVCLEVPLKVLRVVIEKE